MDKEQFGIDVGDLSFRGTYDGSRLFGGRSLERARVSAIHGQGFRLASKHCLMNNIWNCPVESIIR